MISFTLLLTKIKNDMADDIHSSIFKKLLAIQSINDDVISDILSKSKTLNVCKKTYLLLPGDISKHVYFIKSGALRSFYIDSDGNEKVSWILIENDIVVSVNSFFTGNPSVEYLEAVEDCELLQLSKSHLEEIYTKHPQFNYIGRKLIETYYVRSEEQAISLRTLSAKERYERFLSHEGYLLNRIPLGYIASYLGMSQETLSRVRK